MFKNALKRLQNTFGGIHDLEEDCYTTLVAAVRLIPTESFEAVDYRLWIPKDYADSNGKDYSKQEYLDWLETVDPAINMNIATLKEHLDEVFAEYLYENDSIMRAIDIIMFDLLGSDATRPLAEKQTSFVKMYLCKARFACFTSEVEEWIGKVNSAMHMRLILC